MIGALGVARILDGLGITVPSNVEEFLEHKNTLDPSARAVGDIASVHLIGGVIGALVFGRLSNKFGQARAAQPVRGDPRDLAERADVR
jgi:MFS family permease